MLGNGDGTFRSAATYYSGGFGAVSAQVGDVNGDGNLDLLVANPCSSAACPIGVVGVLLGNGDGTFQPAVTYDFAQPLSVAVADVNGDRKLDLVVGALCFPGCDNGVIGVLLGEGNGEFQPAVTYFSGASQSLSVTVIDMNGDGKPDVLVADPCSDSFCTTGIVEVLLGNGDGTFQPMVEYRSGSTLAVSVAATDVNGDGRPDVLVANECFSGTDCLTGSVGVLLGSGNGTFRPAVIYDSGAAVAFSLAVGDVNGDGRPDLVVAHCTRGTKTGFTCFSGEGIIGLLLGNGDGTFQPSVTYGSGGEWAHSVAIADLNGDGRPDLIVANSGDGNVNGSVGVLLNNGNINQSPTTTTLASSLNPSVYGQGVSFAAHVTSSSGTPTGTVVILDGPTAVGSGTLTSGSMSVTVSSLPVGVDSITAAYQGSAGFDPSTSTPLVQTVKAATTVTALASSLNPASTSLPVTLTATVASQFGGAATGSVAFYSGSQSLGSGSLSGNQATLTTTFTSAGTYSISAKFNGDGNNSGSTSPVLSQVIITATTTALTSSLNPSVVGQAVTFTATVASSAGTPPNGEIVTFKNGTAVLGTASLSGGVATLTTSSLAAGIFIVTASYGGDTTFAASTSPGLKQLVNTTTKSATATTLGSSLNPSIYGQKVIWTATVTSSGPPTPTGTVRFTWGGRFTIGGAALNSSGVATLSAAKLNADNYPITAAYSGDANNLSSASSVLNQFVTQTTSAAAISSLPNPSTLGQAVTFTAKITSPTVTPTGPVTFTVGKTIWGTVQLSGGKAQFTTTSLPVGSTTMTVTYAGDSNIAQSSASVTQTVH
jgi:hypothetical protein